MKQKKLVNDYLDTGKRNVKEAILEFQANIRKNAMLKKHRSEIEAIDAVMNEVPELPKDFDPWILNYGFFHERYIFYRAGRKVEEGYCSYCDSKVSLKERPYHNRDGICPKCKSKVIYKAWDKQNTIVDEKRVGIIQRLTDDTGYIYRRFYCKIRHEKAAEYKTTFAGCWEEERYQLDNDFKVKDYFEWGEYKYTGVTRWCHELNHGYYYYDRGRDCVFYARNMKRLLKETELKYMPVNELIKNNLGVYIDPIRMIENLKRQKEYEILIKIGLNRLVLDFTQNKMENIKITKEKRKPWEYFNIKKVELQLAIEMNISSRRMAVLQQASRSNIKLSKEQIYFFAKCLGAGNSLERIFRFGMPGKFQNYFIRELKVGQDGKASRDIRDYFDYLNDCEQLALRMDEHQLFPKNFQTVHHEVAVMRQEKEDKLQKMQIRKKNTLLQKMLPRLKELFSAESEEFITVLPTCKADFTKEGQQNHNCVGGSYFDSMVSGKCVVLFLRRKENMEESFCTVEMSPFGDVKQCRSRCNQSAPSEAMEFIYRLSKRVKEKLKKELEESMEVAVGQ